MRQNGKLSYAPRRLRRAIGVVALAAGLLTAGLPAGTALARPSAASSTIYTFGIPSVSIKALGHTWAFGFSATKGDGIVLITAGLETVSKGIIETHEWASTAAFASTAAKDIKFTSTGHATLKTGSALGPVLAATLTFTPTKRTKAHCATGSETDFSGRITGTVSLVTGLRRVKVSRKYSGKASRDTLSIDRSCAPAAPPAKAACTGGYWTALSPLSSPRTEGSVGGLQTLGAKPGWSESFIRENVPTASQWVTRTDDLFVPRGAVPKLNTKAHTVAVAGTAKGPITGAAKISYDLTETQPVRSCWVGRKHYSESSVIYTGNGVSVSKPFKARMVLTGSQTLVNGPNAQYVAVSLKAK